MSDDEMLARLDAETSRPWLGDLRTDTLVTRARIAVDGYSHLRLYDKSGVIGELVDLLQAVTERLSADSGQGADRG